MSNEKAKGLKVSKDTEAGRWKVLLEENGMVPASALGEILLLSDFLVLPFLRWHLGLGTGALARESGLGVWGCP